VTVCTKGHIIRHVGAILLTSAIGFIMSPPLSHIIRCQIRLRAGITVHPLTGIRSIHIPIAVMHTGTGDWRSALAAQRIIMALSLMGIVTPLTQVDVVNGPNRYLNHNWTQADL